MSSHSSRNPPDVPSKSFAIRDEPTLPRIEEKPDFIGHEVIAGERKKLGEWLATGICGNDITSSCLYVAAIATAYAGVLSPIVLLMVAGLLFLYRKIYAEVGDALPLNGGAYNALLNTTTKYKASMAACFTILSYIATAVISAKTAVEYGGTFFGGLPVMPVTIGLLFFFALLTIFGITESARVALTIFVIHMFTLTILIVFGLLWLITNPETLMFNWHLPTSQNVLVALFFGFAAGLLGISGFESSANFIEEQKPDVFPKTLRNMWIAITVFNPLIALIALSVMTIPDIVGANKALLANVAHELGGNWFKGLITVDAALVLSGAVLTSFIGSRGLISRMTLDRCLPQFLLAVNRRGTQHRIILLFFVLCASILIVTKGDLFALAGVYTISFLCVMSLFAIGNGLLKIRRARLPRRYHASWFAIFIALAATIAGIFGNVMIDPRYPKYFLIYFVPTALVVTLMLARHNILRGILWIANDITSNIQRLNSRFNNQVQAHLNKLNSLGIIFFTKGDDASHLNQAMLYVKENEITNRITVVHVFEKKEDIPVNLESDLRHLDELYPEMHIELVLRKGKFGPSLIDQFSKEYGIPRNYMFLGAPSDKFPYRISDLGGVRLII